MAWDHLTVASWLFQIGPDHAQSASSWVEIGLYLEEGSEGKWNE